MARKRSPLDGLRCEFCGAALSTWEFKKWHDENVHDWLNLHCAACDSAFDESDARWHCFNVWTHRCPDGSTGTVARKE
jgi:hypothetical protein